MDKILGLEYGADDYINQALQYPGGKSQDQGYQCAGSSRRNGKNGRRMHHMVVCGDLKLDREGRRVFIQEKEIKLTAKEFDLLELLVTNPNKVYSREALLGYVWGNKAMDNGDVRTVDVHVRVERKGSSPAPADPNTSTPRGVDTTSAHSNEQCEKHSPRSRHACMKADRRLRFS